MLYSIKSYPKPNLLLCDYTQSFDNIYVGTYIYIYSEDTFHVYMYKNRVKIVSK
jgi:hypothetical protein